MFFYLQINVFNIYATNLTTASPSNFNVNGNGVGNIIEVVVRRAWLEMGWVNHIGT